ncbi:FecR family protein [Filimonas lacunae]|uniref:FecR family protein n=1 Tax=Filimonas lacunae TaxID=477680 RepID=A0A173MK14_9BACT|nr:FecR family protein [Filimonas lacunae]BAV07738.1 anti-sigma factor [Filimonas lacunae]SIT04256.1 FecR family protein [Filimonas lacunae]
MTFQQLYREAGNDRLIDLLMMRDADVLSPAEAQELADLITSRPEMQGIVLMYELEKESLEHETIIIQPVVKRRMLLGMPVRRAVAVAAASLLAVAGTYILVKQLHAPATTSSTAAITPAVKQDVQPGKNRAVLTLANGQQIVLDDAGKGNVAAQGNTQIIKLDDGKLAYNADKKLPGGNSGFNTITTPRGGVYIIQLPDKSMVYLNSASSLRFPVAFTGKERIVEMTGEAYFEVAKNSSQPFQVKAGLHTVQVLGTNFNISAYPEELVSTTLLQGLVRVTNGDVTQQLVPGTQAQSNGPGITLVKHPDLADVMAWKEGVFRFNETTIDDIMKQLARWYDIEVVYAANRKPSEHFMGTIQRNVPLSQVLHLLELTGSIHFTIQGKTVMVH